MLFLLLTACCRLFLSADSEPRHQARASAVCPTAYSVLQRTTTLRRQYLEQGGAVAVGATHPAADMAEVGCLCELRIRVEQMDTSREPLVKWTALPCTLPHTFSAGAATPRDD